MFVTVFLNSSTVLSQFLVVSKVWLRCSHSVCEHVEAVYISMSMSISRCQCLDIRAPQRQYLNFNILTYEHHNDNILISVSWNTSTSTTASTCSHSVYRDIVWAQGAGQAYSSAAWNYCKSRELQNTVSFGRLLCKRDLYLRNLPIVATPYVRWGINTLQHTHCN